MSPREIFCTWQVLWSVNKNEVPRKIFIELFSLEKNRGKKNRAWNGHRYSIKKFFKLLEEKSLSHSLSLSFLSPSLSLSLSKMRTKSLPFFPTTVWQIPLDIFGQFCSKVFFLLSNLTLNLILFILLISLLEAAKGGLFYMLHSFFWGCRLWTNFQIAGVLEKKFWGSRN